MSSKKHSVVLRFFGQLGKGSGNITENANKKYRNKERRKEVGILFIPNIFLHSF